MKTLTCDHRLMREINRLRALNLLREKGPLSRTELAREAGLDAKTITNVTSDLIASKLIVSDSYQDSGGGRPAELLNLNSSLKYSLGIYAGAREIRGVLIDLKGGVVREEAKAIKEPQNLKTMLALVRSMSRALIGAIPSSKLLGLGFVFPGITNSRRETVIQSSNLTYLEGVNIKKTLKRIFKIPVEIEDSSRAMALGEKWFGRAKDIDNFVFIDLGVGIGCAIVSQGRLHYGVSLSAGELGHTVVEINGLVCRCGHRGCLETIASTRRIVEETGKISGASLGFEEILKLNRDGNKNIQKIITEAGYYIGVGVSNLVNILNPSHIIIGGELSLAGDNLFKSIDTAMKEYSVSSSYKAVKVIPASLGEKGGALGAATLILKKIFELKEFN